MNDTRFAYRTAPFSFEPSALSEAVYRKTGLLRRLWRYGKLGARKHRISLLIGLGANLFTLLWGGPGKRGERSSWSGAMLPLALDVVHTVVIWGVVCAGMSVLLGLLALHGRRRARARRQKSLPGIVKALRGTLGALSPLSSQVQARVEIEDAVVTMDKTGEIKIGIGQKLRAAQHDGTSTEYADLRKMLRNQRWDTSRLSVLKSHPLAGMSTDTATRILETFDWDDGKLRALKLLKPWMIDAADQGYKIAAMFSFGSGVESAMEILRS